MQFFIQRQINFFVDNKRQSFREFTNDKHRNIQLITKNK